MVEQEPYKVRVMADWEEADWEEWKRERASIMEFDGELSYREAQSQADIAMRLLRMSVVGPALQPKKKPKPKSKQEDAKGPVQAEMFAELGFERE